jgi:hypothetical protein
MATSCDQEVVLQLAPMSTHKALFFSRPSVPFNSPSMPDGLASSDVFTPGFFDSTGYRELFLKYVGSTLTGSSGLTVVGKKGNGVVATSSFFFPNPTANFQVTFCLTTSAVATSRMVMIALL